MKRFFLITIFLLPGLLLLAQKPEQVYSITRVQKNYDYYNEQAGLWEKEITKTPKDATAWFNYYTAARMNNMFAGEGGTKYDIDVIIENLKTALPNTFEYYYLSYVQNTWSEEGYAYLDKAYAMDSERYEPWDSYITKAEIEGDTKAMKTFFEKWYHHEMYSPGITSWNYNVLIGLDKNALLLTFGDNDTYPLWLLQSLKNIRTDVKLVNISLLNHLPYQEKVFKELGIPAFGKTYEEVSDFQSYRNMMMEHVLKNTSRPAYIGISAPKSFRKKHHDQLYVVGLAFKYSEDDFDHVAVIRKNYETLFLKDYLKTNLVNDFSQSVVDHMNQQYIPCLTVLYKHYLLSGEDLKAQEVQGLLISIGEKNQKEEEIQSFLSKFKK